jgi:vancomycin aglycone glucosyltransferase
LTTRVLLSTIGSRGEVQPVLALATRLRALGHRVHACVPPDFVDLLTGHGVVARPVGPRVRGTATTTRPVRFDPDSKRRMIADTVAAQFAALPGAAQGCDVIVGCGALQIAAPTVAQLLGVPYVHVHFCPVTLPSPHHGPPALPGRLGPDASPRERWAADARAWNDEWAAPLNEHRRALGLELVDDVRSHLLTDRPWLAADPVLGPWPGGELQVVPTGAWLLDGPESLPAELRAFLDDGDPPVYVGLGSMRAPGADAGQVMLDAVRAVGRRAVLGRGWGELTARHTGPDVFVTGEVDHRALFPRLAAAVHHGGAGTTTAAARAGVPQVLVPQRYDQPYWAARVERLGIGAGVPSGMPESASLADALAHALEPGTAERARGLAPTIRLDGTRVAAAHLAEVLARTGSC